MTMESVFMALMMTVGVIIILTVLCWAILLLLYSVARVVDLLWPPHEERNTFLDRVRFWWDHL